MKRATINSLAEQFSNHMIYEAMDGHQKTGKEWAAEFRQMHPQLAPKDAVKVIRRIVRFIKAAGSPNDARM